MGDPEGRSNGEREFSLTTEEDFQRALSAIVREAGSNGVDVEGNWLLTDDDGDVWSADLTEASRRSTVHASDGEVTTSSITEAVMEREDVETEDLPPLYESINPEVLELLFDSPDDGRRFVTFPYYGYRVTVCSDGTITLDE